jgi:hypothetical protein
VKKNLSSIRFRISKDVELKEYQTTWQKLWETMKFELEVKEKVQKEWRNLKKGELMVILIVVIKPLHREPLVLIIAIKTM